MKATTSSGGYDYGVEADSTLGHMTRERIEEEQRSVRDELERRVQERTADLAESNRALCAEIEERQRGAEELERRHQGLLARYRVSEIVLHTRSLDATFQKIVNEIGSRTPFPIVTIEVYDPTRDMMVFRAVKGFGKSPGFTTLQFGILEAPAFVSEEMIIKVITSLPPHRIGTLYPGVTIGGTAILEQTITDTMLTEIKQKKAIIAGIGKVVYRDLNGGEHHTWIYSPYSPDTNAINVERLSNFPPDD